MIKFNLSKYKSNKYLTKRKKKFAGRNNQGRITVRSRGGGHKQLYRKINFSRNINEINTVLSIEYDPNRSSNIAYLSTKDKKKREIKQYIIAPTGLKNLDEIISFSTRKPFMHIGDSYPLQTLPVGTLIHNIELYPNKGGQLARAAGTYGKVLQEYHNKYINISLSSGEQRLIPKNCYATIGMVSNIEHKNRVIGKAGRSRWLDKRPHVRGVAMNPVDHPHGGGEGKTSGGRPSVTPAGRPTKGQPTRSKKKNNKYIIVNRKKL